MDASTKKLVRNLTAGIERDIAALHAPRPISHLVYAFFPALMCAGMVGAYCALTMMPHQAARLAVYWLCVVCTALGMNSCFLLIHEATHGVLLENRRLNRWAGVALGVAGFCAFSAYKVMHIRHHDHLGHAGDPDDYGNYTNRPHIVWLLQYNSLLWATILYLLIIPFASLKAADRDDRVRIIAEYLVLLVIYGIVFAWVPFTLLFAIWIVPFLITNFLINIRGLTQHAATDVHNPALASRSISPSRLVRFFLLNENYHLEHHLFPGVPGYNLHRLSRLIDERIPTRITDTSYLHFLWEFVKASFRRESAPIGLTTRHRRLT